MEQLNEIFFKKMFFKKKSTCQSGVMEQLNEIVFECILRRGLGAESRRGRQRCLYNGYTPVWHTYMYVFIDIYMYVCMHTCICKYVGASDASTTRTHLYGIYYDTHYYTRIRITTHAHSTHTCIYMYVCMHTCIYV